MITKNEIKGLIVALQKPGEKLLDLYNRVSLVMGVSTHRVIRWNAGTHEPTLRELDRLAALSGQTIRIMPQENLKERKPTKQSQALEHLIATCRFLQKMSKKSHQGLRSAAVKRLQMHIEQGELEATIEEIENGH
jgi:hypothetical protein